MNEKYDLKLAEEMSWGSGHSAPKELVLPVIAAIIWFIASFILAVGIQRRILKCLEGYLLLVSIVMLLELIAGRLIIYSIFILIF
jgi:hypothetical protein